MIAADLFTSILAAYNADTGTGGLKNTASAAYVRGGVWRKGDPDDRSQNTQGLIRVEIIEDEDDKFEKDTVAAIVKFDIYTMLEKPTFTTQNAIVARLRAVYHRSTSVPAASSTWTFTDMQIRGGQQAPPSEGVLRYVLSFRVFGRKV